MNAACLGTQQAACQQVTFAEPYQPCQSKQPFSQWTGLNHRGNEVDSFVTSHPDVNSEPLNIEELVKLGQSCGPCPYLLSKEMTASADIVFMPYNYLIDAKTRMGLDKICWENSILIFDEAHNLEVLPQLILQLLFLLLAISHGA